MFYIHHNLRSLSGMKIFTFMRIIEILNIICNNFNKDFDVQLVTLINLRRLKKIIFTSAILLISLFLNIVTFYSYTIALSIALNDSNNFIYPVFLKMNFMEMKKSGKVHKKKKIFSFIVNGN